MIKLSDTQSKVIRAMAQSGHNVSRYKGGYWALSGLPADHFAQSHSNYEDCLCGIQTLRSLEKKGIVKISKVAPKTKFNDSGGSESRG